VAKPKEWKTGKVKKGKGGKGEKGKSGRLSGRKEAAFRRNSELKPHA
jgi:hypothetical protein